MSETVRATVRISEDFDVPADAKLIECDDGHVGFLMQNGDILRPQMAMELEKKGEEPVDISEMEVSDMGLEPVDNFERHIIIDGNMETIGMENIL